MRNILILLAVLIIGVTLFAEEKEPVAKQETPAASSQEESFRYKTEWFSLRANVGNFGGGGTVSFFTVRWHWIFWEIAGFSGGGGLYGGGLEGETAPGEGYYMLGFSKFGMPFFLSADNRHEIRVSLGLSGGLLHGKLDGDHHSVTRFTFLCVPLDFYYVYHLSENLSLQTGFEFHFPGAYLFPSADIDDSTQVHSYVPLFNVFFGIRI